MVATSSTLLERQEVFLQRKEEATRQLERATKERELAECTFAPSVNGRCAPPTVWQLP